MGQELRTYVIRGEDGNYYKGHHENGWLFTSDPKEAFHFDTREETDILVREMNAIIKSSSHHKENDKPPFVGVSVYIMNIKHSDTIER